MYKTTGPARTAFGYVLLITEFAFALEVRDEDDGENDSQADGEEEVVRRCFCTDFCNDGSVFLVTFYFSFTETAPVIFVLLLSSLLYGCITLINSYTKYPVGKRREGLRSYSNQLRGKHVVSNCGSTTAS